jgi:hypothetical protein
VGLSQRLRLLIPRFVEVCPPAEVERVDSERFRDNKFESNELEISQSMLQMLS